MSFYSDLAELEKKAPEKNNSDSETKSEDQPVPAKTVKSETKKEPIVKKELVKKEPVVKKEVVKKKSKVRDTLMGTLPGCAHSYKYTSTYYTYIVCIYVCVPNCHFL